MTIADNVATYLAHTSAGLPMRALARAKKCHASTILRQVRQVEARRDDPLFDEALEHVAPKVAQVFNDTPGNTREFSAMNVQSALANASDFEVQVEREARRILRRLCEKNAFLIVAPDMEKAAVLRETVPGKHTRIAVLDRTVARAFALREWISCDQPGRVTRYSITSVGRAALRRLLDEDRARRADHNGSKNGAANGNAFRTQHQDLIEKEIRDTPEAPLRRVRYNLAESPLTALGRKRTNSGEAYLTAEMVQAGERLREDFEIGQLGPKVGQNWDRFLAATDRTSWRGGGEPSDGAMRARNRLSEALNAMGPGLADIAFRVCCFLEGLETAEKRMGWSARSGKVVLRIALDRLSRHYGMTAREPIGERIKPEEKRRSA